MKKDYIDLNKNDKLSSFSKTDLVLLKNQIKKTYLKYRNTLELPNDLTFGTEIEYEGFMAHEVDKFVSNNLPNWVSKRDSTIRFGGEIISPVMKDETKYWKELKEICEFIKSKNAKMSDNAGAHVHIGTCILGKDIEAWKLFLKLYTIYEPILIRFACGDKINPREKMWKYAYPTSHILYESMKYIENSKDMFELRYSLPTNDRYQALNFRNVDFSFPYENHYKNTIEFRSPNATSCHIIWQNNINAFAKMMVAAKEKTIDEDFLNYKLNNYENNSEINNYYLINIQNALEFVDLVFNNNKDKIYFLRQYFKDFSEGENIDCKNLSKNFIKGGINR